MCCVVCCVLCLCVCLLLVAALVVFDDGLRLLVPCSDVVADSISRAEHEIVGASHEDFFAVVLLHPELLAVAFDLDAFRSFGFGDSFGLGGEFGGGFGDDSDRRHFILAEFRRGGSGLGGSGRGDGFWGCGLLCGIDEILDQVIFGFRRSLLGLGGTTALFGSGI